MLKTNVFVLYNILLLVCTWFGGVCIYIYLQGAKDGYWVPYSITLLLIFWDQLLTTITHLLGQLTSELQDRSCFYQFLQHYCCMREQPCPAHGGCWLSEFRPPSLHIKHFAQGAISPVFIKTICEVRYWHTPAIVAA